VGSTHCIKCRQIWRNFADWVKIIQKYLNEHFKYASEHKNLQLFHNKGYVNISRFSENFGHFLRNVNGHVDRLFQGDQIGRIFAYILGDCFLWAIF
jgi:hypothetical protein